MRCAIIIPARLASTRLPRKILRDDTGQPLICHTLAAALAVRDLAPEIFADVIVAADDDEVVQAVGRHCAARELAARVEMTRPDHVSGSDRVAEVAERLPPAIDAILNLQGDEPEIDPASLAALVRFLAARAEADIATLVYPIQRQEDFHDPNLVKAVLADDHSALYFSRAALPFDREKQPHPPFGWGHIGVYAYRREALRRFVSLPPAALERREKLEQLRALAYGLRIICLPLAEQPAKGIDTPEDYTAFVARWQQKQRESSRYQ